VLPAGLSEHQSQSLIAGPSASVPTVGFPAQRRDEIAAPRRDCAQRLSTKLSCGPYPRPLPQAPPEACESQESRADEITCIRGSETDDPAGARHPPDRFR
jgi:hypothetical protein